MTRSRRGLLSVADELLAVGVGVAVGLATLYLARVWLSREELTAFGRVDEPSGPVSRPDPDRQAPGPADEEG
jgi:hypothetical protein